MLRRVGLLMTAAALAVGVIACGGDDEPSPAGDEAAEAAPASVRVGLLPLAAVAPIYIGIDQGFFEEENLDVEAQLTQGGAATVPSVVSGDLQFGYSNNVSLLLAASQGLPLRIIAEGNQAADNVEDATDAVVVTADSGIEEPEDLEGATIGVNTLENIGDVAIKTALEERGVDVSTLEFVEIPFPEMVPAVEAGRIDAGWVVEPFVQAAEAADLVPLINPFFETAERLSIATYFTSEQYVQENPDVVERFTRALNRSLTFAQENPDELRSIVLEFTEIPPDAAERMNLPYFSTELNVESIELLSEQMVRYDIIDEEPDLAELIPQAG